MSFSLNYFVTDCLAAVRYIAFSVYIPLGNGQVYIGKENQDDENYFGIFLHFSYFSVSHLHVSVTNEKSYVFPDCYVTRKN